jgi:PAS domain S-box-containing protein
MDQDLLEHILNVSRRMAETRDLTPLLNDVMDEAIKLVGAERGYVVLVRPNGSLDFRVKRGQVGQALENSEDQVSRSILNQVIDTSQPLILRDAEHDPRFEEAESVVILKLRSVMCVPLISGGDTIGAIYVENRSIRDRFSEDDLPPLILFANQAAVAVENARLFQELQKSHDELEVRVEERTAELQVAIKQLEQEITERVRTEKALRESEKKYRQLLETLQEGIWAIDKDAYTTFVNPRIAEMLGYTVDEMQEKHLFDFMDEQGVEIAKRNLKRREQGIKEQHDFEFIRKDGDRIYAIIETAPVTDEDGNYIGAIAGVLDITERKRAEEVLQQRSRELALINQASQAFSSTLELDQVLQTVLEEMHQLLGIAATSFWLLIPKTGELVCRRATGPGSEMILGWRLAPGQGIAGQVAQRGEPLIVADTWTERQHFEEIDEKIGLELRSLLSIPLRTKGEVIGVLNLGDTKLDRFTVDDLTLLEPIAAAAASAVKNARLFDEAQQAREAAEQANRAKDIFLATISHELRTPLNGILGYAQILKRDPAITAQQANGLNVIEQSGQHLLTLINDVLDLAKIGAGKLELYQTNFYLPALLRSITDIIRIWAEQKGITFVYIPFDFVQDIPLSPEEDGLPAGVRGDERRLRQVLINLLGNAVKFTQKGNVIFKVGPVRFPEPQMKNWQLRFQVEDTGIGVASEELKTIFEPFRRVDGQGLQTEGTGLGLTVSRSMVQIMGGELKVKSTPGEGSVFWFDLDLPEVSDWVETVKVEEKTIIGFKGEKRKVLVVDDSEENRALLVDLFSSLGFEVLEATNGQEGLEKAKQFKPEAMLIDLVIPVMDGFELTRQIRQSTSLKDVVIIATSARVFEEDQKESLAAGCDAFIPKPIQVETLLAQLQRHLGLNWVYEERGEDGTLRVRDEIDSSLPSSSEALTPPPAEELAVLFDLALRGDIEAIQEQVERLEQLDEQFGPFTAELRRLTKGFQVNRICKFLESYLDQ